MKDLSVHNWEGLPGSAFILKIQPAHLCSILMRGSIPHKHFDLQENSRIEKVEETWHGALIWSERFNNGKISLGKCILSGSIFANTLRVTFTSFSLHFCSHSVLRLYILIFSCSIYISFVSLPFYQPFPGYNIWYSSITLTAALKMSLQQHHISLGASILPSTAAARGSSSHRLLSLLSSVPSSPFQLKPGAKAPNPF